MENVESSEQRKKAKLAIIQLAHMISVPMSLNAVVKLKVADAIWQDGANAPLSASEILSLVNAPGDPENLQRILRMLSSYGVFTEHLHDVKSETEKKYSLTEIGKTLVTDADGTSYRDYVLQLNQDALLRAWPLVHEAVLDSSTTPFLKANGEAAYDYYGKHPEMNVLMQKAMSGVSVPFVKAVLSGYDGFQGVKKLVDVGGSSGDCLKMILQKYPTVEGINFDLPEVVAKAPNIPGITHMGGDMFRSIPSADAIFLNRVLAACTDDECKVTLENCYQALPVGGKLIVGEPALPNDIDDSQRTQTLLEVDIVIMTMYRAKGKTRTEEELMKLGRTVGFSHTRSLYFDYFHTILEFQK